MLNNVDQFQADLSEMLYKTISRKLPSSSDDVVRTLLNSIVLLINDTVGLPPTAMLSLYACDLKSQQSRRDPRSPIHSNKSYIRDILWLYFKVV